LSRKPTQHLFASKVNPFADGLYDVLGEIYDEFQDIFQFDSFHMGGDEVSAQKPI
jgi:N-acetyl-beta-hexosaminidase